MTEPSGTTNDIAKKNNRYTAAIASAITTVIVWFADHKVHLDYKEPLRLTSPFIGLLATWFFGLLFRYIRYFRNKSLLEDWISSCQIEYDNPSTSVQRKKQLREDITDYQQQARENRKQHLKIFDF